MMPAKQAYTTNAANDQWLNDTYYGRQTKEDRFDSLPRFGTAGIRASVGIGSSHFNGSVLQKIVQAVADELFKEAGSPARGAVIAYDSRPGSASLAGEAALTLAANGITAYLFDSLCPTPQLSFAVPYLRAAAGLMITASHNSWKDNGCKIYDEYGCQITPQQAHRLYLAMTSGSDRLIELPEKKSAPAKGSLRPIDKKVTTAYYLSALDGLLNMPLTQAKGSSFSIVYTPFYGAGRKAVSEVLTKAGFNSLFVVPEQEYADGCFATLPRPNPEYHETFKLALKYARQSNADLVLATDPDADRLGLCCKDGDTYNILSGNQVGLLLAYYLFSQKAAQKMLPADGILIRSMVSTPLADKLAAHFGVSTSVTAVGSCHIGAGIMRIKQSGQGSFLFGFEESLGYIMPGHCLEKDAVAAAALAAEAALYYRETKDHTLVQVLANIYRQFGYFLHYQETIALPGYRARERAADFMESLSSLACRECTVEMLADPPFPLILRFIFGEGNYVIVRPSGTEPKIKLYYGAQASTKARASSNLAYLRRSFKRLLEENK